MNKIKFMFSVIVLTLFSTATAFADGTHAGGSIDVIKTSDYDTLSFDVRVSKLNNNNDVASYYSRHSYSYIKKYDLSQNDISASAVLWFCVIKNEGSVNGLYYNNKIVDDVPIYFKENGYAKDEIGNTEVGKDEMPDLSNLNVDNWDYTYVSKETQILYMSATDVGYSVVGDKYDFDVKINSTLPCFYKSFEKREDYDDWLDNDGFDLDKNPNQEYSRFGFTSDGDTSDGNVYDLEPPLKLKCNVKTSLALNGLSAEKYVCTWSQSDNVDVNDWYTQMYVRFVGKSQKFPWSKKEKFDLGYFKKKGMYDEVLNCRNKITFRGDEALEIDEVKKIKGRYRPVITDFYFKTRNTYYDETTTITHYSNWVTWHLDLTTGKMTCVENKDHDLNNKDDDDVDSNSKNYNPSEDYNDKNKGNDTSSKVSIDNFLDYLKQSIDTIGQVPDFMGKVFGWLPGIYVAIIVTGIGLLILLRILGR